MRKENQANLALAVSVLGVIGTAGQGTSLFAATLHHGFLAATIGGLADWFAVKAIFGRPLGISHRTDILRRNRGRIMESLVRFSSDDLLSKKNIMDVVEREKIGELLVEYLQHRGGRERLIEAAVDILRHVASDVDSRHISKELAPYVIQAFHALPLEESFAELLDVLTEEPHADRIFNILIRMGLQLIQTQVFQDMLRENIASIRTEYEGDGMVRAFVLSFFDDEMIAAWLTARLEEILRSAMVTDDRRHREGVQALVSFVVSLRSDPSLYEALHRYKVHVIEHIDVESILFDFIEHRMKGNHPFWVPYVKELLNEKIDLFVHSESWQNRADRWMKDLAAEEVEKHHGMIASFIREYLNQKSDDELISFVEGKVHTDLQMIRVNGAIVGAFVGMALSLVVTFAERMWGL
ncbi:hypothetical protein HMPREF1992_01256 [Selenomonas sp. oral taxon 892 str. F0426]|uniref:DUF445 domain-containing protein n=1 Tax=Selenomonas sp. oral taxon 892 TaxID=1321785 RepID=UPI0003ACDDAC|nr:DUF445 domain-containing protein [Selenomonas sp. oral taxon 892]ERJ92875.1 hypothetical protein HMPREF1992_01256 [Selenomonas sp. oral taxon 892 str. F0426]